MELFEDMKGKVAVVTGATSGVGHASALLLSQHGVKVVLAGRNDQAGKALQDEIIAGGGKALFVKTDVTSAESVERLIESCQNAYGAPHFALNNAGIEGKLGPMIDMEESDFDKVVSTNLKGVWHCLKYQLRAMLPEGGSIVNISTSITRLGLSGAAVYTASKSAVDSLTRVSAIEYASHGIRVNAISPGAVDTPMIHRIYPDAQDIKKLNEGNPMGKMASPKDIANTAMAAHVNGENVLVDGGSSLTG